MHHKRIFTGPCQNNIVMNYMASLCVISQTIHTDIRGLASRGCWRSHILRPKPWHVIPKGRKSPHHRVTACPSRQRRQKISTRKAWSLAVCVLREPIGSISQLVCCFQPDSNQTPVDCIRRMDNILLILEFAWKLIRDIWPIIVNALNHTLRD